MTLGPLGVNRYEGVESPQHATCSPIAAGRRSPTDKADATKEYPIEMGIRGVRSYSIGAEGGMNIMRMIIARELIGGEYTDPRQ